MRICHVAPELLPVPPTKGGAIERWIRDSANRLVRRGHDVHVISRDHGDGATSMRDGGVDFHFIPVSPRLDAGLPSMVARGAWYYSRVRSIVSALQPDIVHHHSRPAGLWISRGPGASVISLHSMDYGWGFGYRGWDRPLFARGLRAADRVFCISDFIRRHAVARYPAIAGRSQTIHNGVDTEVFSPGGHGGTEVPPSQSVPPSHEGPIVLFVGRIEERKGVHILVDAFQRVISPRVPHARLLLVGPSSYWTRGDNGYYDRLSKRCAGDARIELCGPTYDDGELAAIYRGAAVAVVPSTFPEGLGLTALEAQASGVPVVVSDSGGLPETVSAGRSGFVFANGNAEQLGELVVALLLNAERRHAVAEAARQWAVGNFSWDVIAARFEAEYEAVRAGGLRGAA